MDAGEKILLYVVLSMRSKSLSQVQSTNDSCPIYSKSYFTKLVRNPSRSEDETGPKDDGYSSIQRSRAHDQGWSGCLLAFSLANTHHFLADVITACGIVTMYIFSISDYIELPPTCFCALIPQTFDSILLSSC